MVIDPGEEFNRKIDHISWLIKEWNKLQQPNQMTLAEFLLRNGADIEVPAMLAQPGTAGSASTPSGRRRLLKLRKGWYVSGDSEDGQTHGDGWYADDQVSNFTPDILLTQETYRKLKNYFEEDREADIIPGAVFDILDEWAREQGLDV